MIATTYRATAIVCAVLSLATVLVERTVNAQTPPASAGPADPVLIEDLVAAYRILADQASSTSSATSACGIRAIQTVT
jgi:hypothetical protein